MTVNISKNWFEVDRAGLRQLMEGKPKAWIFRELIANSFDESITRCDVSAKFGRIDSNGWGKARISVQDDSPEGFKRLSDAFTMFAASEKRSQPTQRGRFALGEKQVLALADSAEIITTKGRVLFGDKGRGESDERLQRGSVVTLVVRMTQFGFDEAIAAVKRYIVPEGVSLYLNGELIPARILNTTVRVDALPTETIIDGQFRRSKRNTHIRLYRPIDGATGTLFEMGIPVQSIDAPWDVDVQQKIPLAIDRDTVSDTYLARIYAEVLNVTHSELQSDCSSEPWIREAASHPLITSDATRSVIAARFGEKVVVSSFDWRSNDDALSAGYQVVHGSQMSKGEWENVRKADAMPSAAEVFPHKAVAGETVVPTPDMIRVIRLVGRIGDLCLGFQPRVEFARFDGVRAQYGNRTVTFNVKALGEDFFSFPGPRFPELIDLIVHELAHEYGTHTQREYLDAITRFAGLLVVQAIENPTFFTQETEASQGLP